MKYFQRIILIKRRLGAICGLHVKGKTHCNVFKHIVKQFIQKWQLAKIQKYLKEILDTHKSANLNHITHMKSFEIPMLYISIAYLKL